MGTGVFFPKGNFFFWWGLWPALIYVASKV